MVTTAFWSAVKQAPLLGGGGLTKAVLRKAMPGYGGRLRVASTALPGGGAGFSTMSGLAGLRLCRTSAPLTEARLLWSIEGAVDPLMFPQPERLIWASRRIEIIEKTALAPKLWAVGGYDGPPVRTDPHLNDFEDVSDLLDQLRRGRIMGDESIDAQVATESAHRNQKRLPKPRFTAIVALARSLAAAGVAVAHTGSGICILFRSAAREPRHEALRRLAKLGVQSPHFFDMDTATPLKRLRHQDRKRGW